jgi:hypothetical protein
MELATGAPSPAEEAGRSRRRPCCRAIGRGGHGESTEGRMEDISDALSPAAENTDGHQENGGFGRGSTSTR